MSAVALLLLLACSKTVPVGAPVPRHPDVPERPEDLVAHDTLFTPPISTDYRHELPGGIPVFIVPGRDIPLVDITLDFAAGEYLETPGQYGIADLTGTAMRSGGAGDLSPDALEDELAFLAADVTSAVSMNRATVSINCVTENLDACLALLVDIVRRPRFDADRLALSAGDKVERMTRRNDNADNIATREWQAMLYGRNHPEARYATAATVQSITRDDVVAFHSQVFHPGNLVIGVSGDVEPADILEQLAAALDGWKPLERAEDPPAPTHEMTPGLYHIEKDVPQAKVRIGMRGPQRSDPDAVPLLVMSQIVGGGTFTARLMKRIRTEEGLSYGAYATMQPEIYYPGEYTTEFQTRSATTALAVKIAFEEFRRIRDEPVSDEELAGAKRPS